MPNIFSLNRSLGGAISAIALVSVLSGGAVLVTLNQLREASEALARSNHVIRSLDAFRSAMLNQETGLRGYLITGREGSLEPYRAGRPALDETINRLNTLIGNEAESSRLLADAVTAARAWQTNIGEAAIRGAADPATRPQAVRIEAEGSGKQLFDTLRAKLAAIETMAEHSRVTQNGRLARADRDASLALWGGALLTLLICAGIGIAINRLIVRPLGGVLAFVERVGTGDLTGRTPAVGRDEIGRLATTLNAMVDGLADLARTNRAATSTRPPPRSAPRRRSRRPRSRSSSPPFRRPRRRWTRSPIRAPRSASAPPR